MEPENNKMWLPACILCRLRRRSSAWISKVCGALAYDRSRRVLTGVQITILYKNNKEPWRRLLKPWRIFGIGCTRYAPRRGYIVNMAAMEEGKIDVVVKLKREQRKKDEPQNCMAKNCLCFGLK